MNLENSENSRNPGERLIYFIIFTFKPSVNWGYMFLCSLFVVQMQCELQQQISSEPQSLKEEQEAQRLLQVRSCRSLILIVTPQWHFYILCFILLHWAFVPWHWTKQLKQARNKLVHYLHLSALSCTVALITVTLIIFSLYCCSCIQVFC